MASFCFIPWEYVLTGWARSPVSSNASAYRRMRASRSAFGTAKMSAMKFKYWMPDMYSYRSGLSGMYAMTRLQAMGSSCTHVPFTSTRPSSGCRMPQQILIVVVLPAPLWPMKPQISPGAMESVR